MASCSQAITARWLYEEGEGGAALEREWEELISASSHERLEPRLARALLEGAIPHALRPAAWLSLSGGAERMAEHAGVYARMHPRIPAAAAADDPAARAVLSQIEKDLKRTDLRAAQQAASVAHSRGAAAGTASRSPATQSSVAAANTSYFTGRFPQRDVHGDAVVIVSHDKECIASLRRVLCAYAAYEPSVSYVQGMNYIVASLLVEMSEEEAFWMLVLIVQDFLPDHYSQAMVGNHVDCHVLHGLCVRRIPKLASRLAELDISMQLLCARWFLCLWSSVLPHASLVRVWDYLFAMGPCATMPLALACLHAIEIPVLAAADVGQALAGAKDALAAAEGSALVRIALLHEGTMGTTELAMLRLDGRQLVVSELDVLETLRTLHELQRGCAFSLAQMRELASFSLPVSSPCPPPTHGVDPAWLSKVYDLPCFMRALRELLPQWNVASPFVRRLFLIFCADDASLQRGGVIPPDTASCGDRSHDSCDSTHEHAIPSKHFAENSVSISTATGGRVAPPRLSVAAHFLPSSNADAPDSYRVDGELEAKERQMEVTAQGDDVDSTATCAASQPSPISSAADTRLDELRLRLSYAGMLRGFALLLRGTAASRAHLCFRCFDRKDQGKISREQFVSDLCNIYLTFETLPAPLLVTPPTEPYDNYRVIARVDACETFDATSCCKGNVYFHADRTQKNASPQPQNGRTDLLCPRRSRLRQIRAEAEHFVALMLELWDEDDDDQLDEPQFCAAAHQHPLLAQAFQLTSMRELNKIVSPRKEGDAWQRGGTHMMRRRKCEDQVASPSGQGVDNESSRVHRRATSAQSGLSESMAPDFEPGALAPSRAKPALLSTHGSPNATGSSDPSSTQTSSLYASPPIGLAQAVHPEHRPIAPDQIKVRRVGSDGSSSLETVDLNVIPALVTGTDTPRTAVRTAGDGDTEACSRPVGLLSSLVADENYFGPQRRLPRKNG